jgi:hypothetical protein
VVSPRDRLLAGAPRRTEQVVMQDDDLEGAVWGVAQSFFCARQLG